MIKIFIPEIKVKRKTLTRGFWRNDTGKLFYDYISIQDYKDNNINGLNNYLYNLKKFYKQECIAYTLNGKLYLFYDTNKIEVLEHNAIITVNKHNRKQLKNMLKILLQEYNGVTVYITRENYILESYYN